MRRADDAVCLRRDQGLVVDLREQRRLDELGVEQGRGHAEDRLVGVHDRALGQRGDVPAKTEAREIVEKIVRKKAQRMEIIDVGGVKVHVLNVLDDLLESRKDGKAAVVRVPAIKSVENDAVVRAAAEIVAVGHRHLVKVHHHGDVSLIVLFHNSSRRSGFIRQLQSPRRR